jgi:hypothetical protein
MGRRFAIRSADYAGVDPGDWLAQTKPILAINHLAHRTLCHRTAGM